MSDLTICQEYLLCTLNKKGKFSALDSYSPICFLAGGLLDLISSQSISIDEKNRVQIIGELKPEYQHLSSLYDFIKGAKPKKVDDLTMDYIFTITDKRINELMSGVGTSLVEKQCVETTESGFWGKRTYYIPKPEATDRVVQKIRAELLEDGVVSDNTIALVGLLNKSNDIKKYFSKYEKEQLTSRLKEIKNAPSSKMAQTMIDTVDAIVVIMTVAASTASD